MITPNISAYFRFEQLPEYKNVTRKGVTEPRKQPRFDLTAMAGYWSALDALKNHKGQLYFNLIPTDKNEYRKQEGTTPEYYLQCTPAKSKAINFSGIRFQYENGKETFFANGEPSNRETLKGGVKNPMYGQRNDAFLFLFSKDMQVLEVLVIEHGRLLIDAYRKQLSMGGLDGVISSLRGQAKTTNSL
ncbi:hypothetical protein LJC68_09735 [Bacteroidales bacterium OttesenSCG-928-B11]|nr:hypothetical protein [Bacteroidales bacterium OttesenSCG-928-E04]MDL2313141.1 hypothetical protein [Bacteroidales bacterium OttesenSCG-928-B11]MDL2326814.1 hypothetical protein [Bacteroidales bacterium OttesenSCG-928-A14]